MIIVIGSIEAKPECHSEVLKLSLDHVQRSRAESGCIKHNVSVDQENPSKFVFVEYWADMAALQVHFDLDASKGFVTALSGLAASKPEMSIFDASALG